MMGKSPIEFIWIRPQELSKHRHIKELQHGPLQHAKQLIQLEDV
jgi:hypothetical protein